MGAQREALCAPEFRRFPATLRPKKLGCRHFGKEKPATQGQRKLQSPKLLPIAIYSCDLIKKSIGSS